MLMNWLRALGVFGASLALVGFAACGGDDDDTGGDGPAQTASGAVKVAQDAKFGAILTNAEGRTLYTFTQDSSGKSACSGTCAQTWPPVVASDSAKVDGATGDFSLVTRDDGQKQLALNGRPLYTYAGDSKSGDTTGDGVGGVWFVAKASGQAPAAASGTTPSAGGTASTSSGSGDSYGY
jgi:predicted lipoprotein with Yx(FWY)xxD motif